MAKESSRSFLFFNGINSYITLPANSLPTGAEITISFWSYGGDALPAHTTSVSAVDVHGNRMLNVHMP